ncbi:MAG: ABC transporter permease, partial [Tannerellaceae bacterium]|nr:ABC transporter permease [Tannerellaceae bacterium]
MEEQKFDTVVIADQKLIKLNLAEVWKYRDLLVLFVKRNFISQYKQTILGPLWAIIKPFLTTVVVTIVFGNVAGLGPDGIPSFAFYFSGTVRWNYLSYCFS